LFSASDTRSAAKSGRAIRWLIALMDLCWDAPAIATVAAALAPQHSSCAQNLSPTDRSALVEFAPRSRSRRKCDYSLGAARLCFFRFPYVFPYACTIVVNPPPAPLVRMSMTTFQLVVQHVPYLRRYARVLTGNQASGDSYVAATLEVLVKEPDLLALAEHPRIALYQVFSRIWNSVQVNTGAEPAVNLVPAERHLGQITAMPRQAFLLVSVEGFSEEDAAAILDVDQQKLQDLVDESGRELAVQIATDVLIIEDEMVIALDLEQLVENLGHRTIGIARTRAEAIELSRVRRPGLILADIQLADGSSGLEAVNDLLNSFEVPVIFISAHPERFLTGERPEPAFLISKPYQQSTVSAVVSQALFFERNARQPKKRAIE
jgi:CheY-like chemotaxis protein/DNA-directed RNA polymerase specialized sigma24 family protein